MLRDKGIEEPGTISADVPVCAELLIEIQGDNFAYAAQAIGANSHQALIRTSAPLCLGTPVTIYLTQTGRSATGRIISETRELSHFEVEFTTSDPPGLGVQW